MPIERTGRAALAWASATQRTRTRPPVQRQTPPVFLTAPPPNPLRPSTPGVDDQINGDLRCPQVGSNNPGARAGGTPPRDAPARLVSTARRTAARSTFGPGTTAGAVLGSPPGPDHYRYCPPCPLACCRTARATTVHQIDGSLGQSPHRCPSRLRRTVRATGASPAPEPGHTPRRHQRRDAGYREAPGAGGRFQRRDRLTQSRLVSPPFRQPPRRDQIVVDFGVSGGPHRCDPPGRPPHPRAARARYHGATPPPRRMLHLRGAQHLRIDVKPPIP